MTDKIFTIYSPGHKTFKETIEWISNNKEEIRQNINENGAIRLTSFPIYRISEFDEVLATLLGTENFSYYGGTSPRTELAEGVFTSTNMPFYQQIPCHSEMVYRDKFPAFVSFFCEKAPWINGTTPYCDNRNVLKSIPEILRNKIIENKITYYRKLKKMNPILKILSLFNPMIEVATWDHVFKTSNKIDVENYCHKHNYEFDWLNTNTLILKTTLPAIKEDSWLNSIHFFQIHERIWGRLPTLLFKMYLKLTGNPDLSATLGNGEKLTNGEIAQIVDAYESNLKEFEWKRGDIMILNNNLFSHGRKPYIGKRKIRVSLKGDSCH